jgi:ferredoxin--NADP+ reductase
MRFLRRPVRILGTRRVEALVLERNDPLGEGGVRATGSLETLEVGMVFRAVGYRAMPLPGVPFDDARSVIPNAGGRVLGELGRPTGREYVTGWAKRGPSGVIGTNKSDAAETVASLVADLAARASRCGGDPHRILALLDHRGVGHTDWASWLRLDEHELELGRAQGRPRVKIPLLGAMLELCRGSRAVRPVAETD